MIRKLNDVSHKVKADASFFNQEKNRQLEIPRKTKKQKQAINMKQRKCGKT